MATAVIVRGNTVNFKTNFYDINGNLVNPNGATLFLSWKSNVDTDTSTSIAMTAPLTGFDWTATWESSVAFAGDLDWCVKSAAPTPFSVEQGTVTIEANKAN